MAKKETKKQESAEIQEKPEGFNLSQSIQETREELAKVVWPSRQQLLSESAAVILMVSLVATVIYLVDQLFAFASRTVFQ